MTNKVLNIIIAILTAFIVVYFAIRIVYWSLEIDKADEEYNRGNNASITYTIDR